MLSVPLDAKDQILGVFHPHRLAIVQPTLARMGSLLVTGLHLPLVERRT